MGSSRPHPKRLAARLRQIRTPLGLPQRERVKKWKTKKTHLTVYPGNISRFEQGQREPPLNILLAYAKAARVNIDVLVDDDLELPGPQPARRRRMLVRSK